MTFSPFFIFYLAQAKLLYLSYLTSTSVQTDTAVPSPVANLQENKLQIQDKYVLVSFIQGWC
jgi:hypothetical protein